MDDRLPIIQTKILMPRRREELLSRNRLLDALNELLDLKLIIVSAPAGYGKTSLLIDFASRTKLPISWFALDPLDRDLSRFVFHFISAIQTHFPEFGQTTLAQLKSMQQERMNLSVLVSTIVNDLYEHVTEHFAIILDDYHLVEESEDINRFINDLLQNVDENFHLICASRKLLTLPDLTLFVARNQVGGLSFEELSFLPSEIQALMLQNYQQLITDESAEAIMKYTEGWVTGLLLSTHLFGKDVTDKLRAAKVSGVGVYEYLAQQVLERQEEDVQHFLLRTSILEEFDAELCADVIGGALDIKQNWHQLMNTVTQRNLFVVTLDGDKSTWLRYHHLFRDFLQLHFRRQCPEEAQKIAHTLADLLLTQQEWERAYGLYRDLKDTAAIVALIETAGSMMIANGKTDALKEWLNALPEYLVNTNAALLSLLAAIALAKSNPQESLHLSQQAMTVLVKYPDAKTFAFTNHRQAMAYFYLGQYQQALEVANRVLSSLEKMTGLDFLRAEAARVMGVTYYQLGNLEQTIYWLKQALVFARKEGNDQFISQVTFTLGMIYKTRGEYTLAETAYAQVISHWQKSGNLQRLSTALNSLGVLQHYQKCFSEAVNNIEKAITYARSITSLREEMWYLASLGDIYRDLDARNEALDIYGKAHTLARQIDDKYLIFYLDLAEGIIYRQQHDFQQSQNLLASALSRAEESSSVQHENLCRLELAALKLVQRDFQTAYDYLQPVQVYLKREGYLIEHQRAQLLISIACAGLGDLAKIDLHLQEVNHTLAHSAYKMPLIALGRELIPLLQSFLPAVRSYFVPILNEIDGFEVALPALRRQIRHQVALFPFATPRLAFQAFGRTQVKINAQPINLKDWQAQNVRDLIFVLLANPEGLTREQIGAYFWQDISSEELKFRLKNTLYRLRRVIGTEAVLLEDDYYRFNWALDYEYDVEGFVAGIKNSQSARGVDEKIQQYVSAIKNYHGVYLADVEDTWVVADREHYAQLYIEALLHLTQLYIEKKAYRTALRYCNQALSEDACLEEAHRMAMRIHAVMGNRAAVVRQYERCLAALKEEIQAPPSDETRALYELLLA